MIVDCGDCRTQNFVAPERRAAPRPPLCWRCGAPLQPDGETPSSPPESYGTSGDSITTSEERDG